MMVGAMPRGTRSCTIIVGGDSAGTPGGAAAQINGAGATFPYPIYSKWFAEYNRIHPDVRINYQSLGSGAGIRQLTSRTVFFGASDQPMNDEQLGGACVLAKPE